MTYDDKFDDALFSFLFSSFLFRASLSSSHLPACIARSISCFMFMLMFMLTSSLPFLYVVDPRATPLSCWVWALSPGYWFASVLEGRDYTHVLCLCLLVMSQHQVIFSPLGRIILFCISSS